MTNENNIMRLFQRFSSRDDDRESNVSEDAREAVKLICSRSDFIRKYYSSRHTSCTERKTEFLKIADTLSRVKDVINIENMGAIIDLFSIANNYNKSMSYLSSRFQDSGPFLAFPRPIDDCLNFSGEMAEIGNYLFESRESKGTFDSISLVDYLEVPPIQSYCFMNIKNPILARLIGNRKLNDKLRASAFNKLEQLSEATINYDKESKSYLDINEKDFTYYHFVIGECVVRQHKNLKLWEPTRDYTVQKALQSVEFNMDYYKNLEEKLK